MIAVIFEAEPHADQNTSYLDLATELKPLLMNREGFISIERFQSLTTPGRILSLSFWETEEAIRRWRELPEHRTAQSIGRSKVFSHYRLRVAQVIRDYGMNTRGEAPSDSRLAHARKTYEGDLP